MPGHLRSAVLLLLAALLLAPPAGAYHAESEPSDGTVRSFRPVEPPRQVPDSVNFSNEQGERLRLADFQGKVVLLNLWATWCPPCVRELPALDRLQERLGGEDFQVVALSLDQGGADQARPFFERLDIDDLTLYLDPRSRVGHYFPVDVLPANFIIDRQGRVSHYLRSYVDWDAPEVDALFTDLMRDGRSDIPGSSPVLED